MDKLAAEKIAEHYYAQGSQLALQKLANLGPLKLRRDLISPLALVSSMLAGAGAGGYGALKGALRLGENTKLVEALQEAHAAAPTLAAGGAGLLGLGAGAALAGKGAKSFLNKAAPIERYLDLGVAQIPLGKVRM